MWWWILVSIVFVAFMYYIANCIENAHEINDELEEQEPIIWEEKQDLTGKKYYTPKKQSDAQNTTGN